VAVSAHVAGLLVTVHPDVMDEVAGRLDREPGVEVHIREHQTGRLVVTLDTPTLDDQRTRFRVISNMPGVQSVDLVCHYVDPGDPEIELVGAALRQGARP
jgi:nitrate reductase NapAB chaperone NapD